MKTNYIKFFDRASRSKYLAKKYKDFLFGKILDVGCDRAILKKLIKQSDTYLGIDISGDPDIKIDLEKIDNLPFEDQSFDSVICTDVLEHLDNLHHVFDELVRVTKKYLIISLPNNWVNARRPIKKGRGAFAHYGLPEEPPKDRHKWFFNITDAIAFLNAKCKKYKLTIKDQHITEKPKFIGVRLLRKMIYLKNFSYQNRYCNTLWTVFSKE